MSVRGRLFRLLDRGHVPHARGNEAFDPATSVRSHDRIRVRRRDVERALEITSA